MRATATKSVRPDAVDTDRAPCGHREGAHHDCDYVNEINKLIPFAERHAIDAAAKSFGVQIPVKDLGAAHTMARRLFQDEESRELYSRALDRLFHKAMRLLTEANGLRNPMTITTVAAA